MSLKTAQRIDVHTHILPKRLPRFKEKFGYGGFIELDHHQPGCARMMRDDGTFFREIQSNCWDPHIRVQDCDRDLVSVQVLSTVPVLFSYHIAPRDGLEVARFLNDHMAESVSTHPDRFVGLGTLPMQDTGLAIQELERCVRDLGLAGIEIGTHVNGRNLDDPDLFPILQAAEQLGAAIFVHPWDMLGGDRLKKYWFPWLLGMPAELSIAIASLILSGTLDRLPRLRICFAHGGGSFPALLGRITHGHACRPDLVAIDQPAPPEDSVRRIFVDSLVHDPRVLRLLLEVFGADRILLGSDYPFPLGEEPPGRLAQSMAEAGALSADQLELLMAGSARRWLGWDAL